MTDLTDQQRNDASMLVEKLTHEHGLPLALKLLREGFEQAEKQASDRIAELHAAIGGEPPPKRQRAASGTGGTPAAPITQEACTIAVRAALAKEARSMRGLRVCARGATEEQIEGALAALRAIPSGRKWRARNAGDP